MTRPVRLLPVGRSALLVEVDPGLEQAAATLAVRAWADVVEQLAGALRPVDVVPGARTLLLDGVDPAAATRLLRQHPPAAGAAGPGGRLVEVPVSYDGVDLGAVARWWGTDERGVVERHTATELTVAFCGFAPGFPYLTGLDVEVPRHRSPRPAVPAGSVALAGRWCGIYPRASPGGWQLLGRTGVLLFDPDRDPPALLPPGTRVRFVEGRAGRRTVPRRPVRPDPLRAVEVVRAGARTTVQDAGRPGRAHLGAPRSGALDVAAARLANRLVGNPEGCAVLEVTAGGTALRTRRALAAAVTGAPAEVTAGGRAADAGAAVLLRAGELLEVGPARRGLRTYVALAGGIEVDPVLGSRSTDTLSGLGPAVLADGDVLAVGPAHGPPSPVHVPAPTGDTPVLLDLRPGPRDDRLGPGGLERLAATGWTVSPLSDRVGLRLTGDPLPVRAGELDSEGLVLGAVQVPPDGQPVVLLADHPTTGGYPVVGVVDAASVAALAQARPGTPVTVRLLPRSG